MSQSDISIATIIEKTINRGREDHSSEFKRTTIAKIVKKENFKNFKQFSHAMIYCKSNATLYNIFPVKAAILVSTAKSDSLSIGEKFSLRIKMQMRYDGYIGFPGGLVNKDETPVQGLCRVIKERLGWHEAAGAITDNNYMFSFANEKNEMLLHFYVKEVSENKFLEIEGNSTKAPAFGTEVLGNIRVPLYVMGDAFRGFPSFLRNHFISSCKLQLIEAIIQLEFFQEEEIVQALHSTPRITL